MEGKENIRNEKTYYFYAATVAIIFFLHSQQILASNSPKYCMEDSANLSCMSSTCDASDLFIINADYTKGIYPDNVLFSGNVDVKYENNHLVADRIQIHKQHPYNGDASETILMLRALGNVCYENAQIFLKGKRGLANLNTKDIDIWEGEYQILGHQGHGQASFMRKTGGNRYIILKNASFTSCVPSLNIWSIVGSKVIHDREKQVAKIWNARFKLGSVPVFYSPYLQLPIGEKRHSGFLIPSAKYSTSNGFELHFPYYWNIKPAMDATTTLCYIHKLNNIMWKNELRYLVRFGTGMMKIDYLPSFSYRKRVLTNKHEKGNKRDYLLFFFQNSWNLDKIWRINFDYAKVSNPFHFSKIHSQHRSGSNVYTTQNFGINYFGNNFNTTVSAKRFQFLNQDSNRNNYKTKPKLEIAWNKKNIGPFDLHIYTQRMAFINPNLGTSKLTRIHFEPTITLPLKNKWASFESEAKLMITRYQKTELDWNNKTCNTETIFKNSFNRVLPQFKIEGKSLLKRNRSKEGNYIQILEPRVQYLYVPYHSYKKIRNCDSSFLQLDYDGLFRDRLYSGIDCISSMNQLKAGIQAYIYDNTYNERFKIAIGQSYFFAEPCIENSTPQKSKNKKNGLVFLVSDVYWNITNRWNLRNEFQYNFRINNLAIQNSILEYLYDAEHTVQLGYHYTNPKRVQATSQGCASRKQYKNEISKVGGTISWPIINQWSIIGSCHFDTKAKKLLDHTIGLQHTSCCCSIRFGYERKINNWNSRRRSIGYDKVFDFNIELRGLGPNSSIS